MAKEKTGKDEPTVIKKYANRRLYDTGRSSYVTLDDLREMVQEGHDFVVVDAKSGEDLTRGVLTQIIADQESTDETLLPTNFLKTLIGFYGDNAQPFLPSYLEQTMSVFAQNQENMQKQFAKSFSEMHEVEKIFSPTMDLEELTRRNMEMFEKAMKMVPPFMSYNTDNSKENSK